MEKIERSVVVVDDDAFIRSLIKTFLTTSGFEVHTAASALEAIKLIRKVDPDALVLDIDLGEALSGIDVAARVNPSKSGAGLVFLTSLSDMRFANTSVQDDFPGAAYLNKNLLNDPQTLLNALNAVLYEENVADYRQDRLEGRPLGELTRTQIQVLQLIASGKTNQQISEFRGTTIEATEALISRLAKAVGIDTSKPLNSRVLVAREYLKHMNFTPSLPE